MSESLFTSQTPGSANNSDGSAPGISTSTAIVFATAGTVSAIRFYATTTVSGNYIGELWQIATDDATHTGATRLAVTSTIASGSITSGTWNTISIGPVSVSTSIAYRAVINSSAGRYVSTASFFSGVDLTNGNLTAYRNSADPVGIGSISNGTFADATAGNTYPFSQFNQTCYFADVVFDATGVAQPTKPLVASFAVARSTSW